MSDAFEILRRRADAAVMPLDAQQPVESATEIDPIDWDWLTGPIMISHQTGGLRHQATADAKLWRLACEEVGLPLHRSRGYCSQDGCAELSVARGLCDAHYRRSLKNQDLTPPIGRIRKPCSQDGCSRPSQGHGFCGMHYVRDRNGRDMTAPANPRRLRGTPPGTCSCDGCARPVIARGLCVAHWNRQKAGRDLDAPVRPQLKRNGHTPAPTMTRAEAQEAGLSRYAGRQCTKPGHSVARYVSTRGCVDCSVDYYAARKHHPTEVEDNGVDHMPSEQDDNKHLIAEAPPQPDPPAPHEVRMKLPSVTEKIVRREQRDCRQMTMFELWSSHPHG